MSPISHVKGRGTPENPANRFDRLHLEPIESEGPPAAVPTEYFRDRSRSLLVKNDSPDLPFRWSINPYRGCEHGCAYCYARPSHQYLGFRAGLDFETRILVKERAPALLRRAFLRPGWQPETVAMSGNTDCYQPIERRLQITRGCLEVFREFRNPVGIITKNTLVTRDIDLLADLARFDAARVVISVTSLDPELSGALEPRAARPERRLETIRALAAEGIPVGGLVAPVIPGLNDHEVPEIVAALADAGATHAAWILLRLPEPVDRLFDDWLQRHRPEQRDHVIARIRDTRAGQITDSRFGRRMRGQGPYADQIAALFAAAAARCRLDRKLPPASTAAFRRPKSISPQRELFP